MKFREVVWFEIIEKNQEKPRADLHDMKRSEIQKRLENLKQQLVANYAPQKIILFGSAATDGEVINDIDLLIIKEAVPHLIASDLPFEKVHDLVHLLRTCSGHDREFTELKEECVVLNIAYIETRYPVH